MRGARRLLLRHVERRDGAEQGARRGGEGEGVALVTEPRAPGSGRAGGRACGGQNTPITCLFTSRRARLELGGRQPAARADYGRSGRELCHLFLVAALVGQDERRPAVAVNATSLHAARNRAAAAPHTFSATTWLRKKRTPDKDDILADNPATRDGSLPQAHCSCVGACRNSSARTPRDRQGATKANRGRRRRRR